MREVREVSDVGGSGSDHLRKVLPRVGPGGATIWLENLGVDGSNAAKTRGVARGFPAAGDRYEGLKAGGGDLDKGGVVQSAPCSRDQISLVIHQQEAGNGI